MSQSTFRLKTARKVNWHLEGGVNATNLRIPVHQLEFPKGKMQCGFFVTVVDVSLALEKTIYNFEPAASRFYLSIPKERCADMKVPL